MMLIIGIIPPSGVKESCMELTQPQLVSVVTVANNAELATPKRTSLPSMFPPGCVALAVWSIPCSNGLPLDSAEYVAVIPTTNNTAIAAHTAHPCFGDP